MGFVSSSREDKSDGKATGFDVKCQGEVGDQEQTCSGDQHKLRFLLFQNPLTLLHVGYKVNVIVSVGNCSALAHSSPRN